MSCFVGLLFLCAWFSATLCVSPETRLVEKLIADFNQYCRDNNITAIELEEFLEKPVSFEKGWMGEFGTLYNMREALIDTRTLKNGIRYYYNLEVGMKKTVVNYPFKIVLPTANVTGTYTIDAGNSSFHVDGNVDIGNDGSCSALTDSIYLYQLENSQGKIDPKDIPIPEIRHQYEGIINGIIEEITSEVSSSIEKLQGRPKFIKIFNDVVCSGMKKYV